MDEINAGDSIREPAESIVRPSDMHDTIKGLAGKSCWQKFEDYWYYEEHERFEYHAS